jgi:hypothetical protein
VTGAGDAAEAIGGYPWSAKVAGDRGDYAQRLVRRVRFEAGGGEKCRPATHGPRVVAAAFDVVPWLAGTHIALVDRATIFTPSA